ncbi:hypothetical protein AgCh_019605 [Apium graveolens]
MAETLAKRHREEEEEISDIQDENREAKRYKSYNTTTNNKQQALVSFLEQQEDQDDVIVSSQDLSLFLTNLQHELFSDPSPYLPDPSQLGPHAAHQTLVLDPTTKDWNICSKEDDEKESVIIRHLLEASDDELGLPNEVGVDRTVSSGDEDFNGLDDKHNSSLFCDGLWELEDEAANYDTLLQSQLFM